MLKGNLTTFLALSCSAFFLLVVWSIHFFGDDLFFHSDLVSQLVILSALALLPALSAIALLTPILVCCRSCSLVRIRRFMEHVFFVWFVACSAWFGLEFFVLRKLAPYMPKAYISAEVEAILLGGLLVMFYALLRRSNRREHMVRRSTAVAHVIFSIAVAVTLCAVTSGLLARYSNEKTEKHFILVVLDRCPSQCFSIFSPLAGARDHDSVYRAGRVYVNVRTSLPNTHGYFGALYRGTTKKGGGSRGDLLTLLQAEGVRTRVLADHRNALPEGSSLRLSSYKGLRSSLLKSFMSPLLNILNLDYNFIYRASYTGRMDKLLSLLPEALASSLRVREPTNRLETLLIPEVENIRKVARKSFLVFHTDWQTGESLPMDTDSHSSLQKAVRRKILYRDSRYTAQESWYAELIAAQFDIVADHLLCRMSEFLSEMSSRGLLANTIVLFTSDHGTIARDGRIGYGKHSQEEVLRVATVAYGDIELGIDQRCLSTPDISQTILDYFAVEERLDPEACSLLSDREKPFIASFIDRCDIYKELFLVIYKQKMKYLFNLHPLGNGECIIKRFKNPFLLETVATGQTVLTGAATELLQAMSDFDIKHASTNEVQYLFTQEHLNQVSLSSKASKESLDQNHGER